MRPCCCCPVQASYILYPGNVKNGIAYCADHIPQYVRDLIGTPSVVAAGLAPVEEPAPVEEAPPAPAPKASKKKAAQAPAEDPAPVEDDVTPEA